MGKVQNNVVISKRMKENKITPIRKSSPFSSEAEIRWGTIPKQIQKNILDNVWCSHCSHQTTLILESAKMERKDLILRGTCKVCGKSVCRVVEPENE